MDAQSFQIGELREVILFHIIRFNSELFYLGLVYCIKELGSSGKIMELQSC